MTDATRAIGIGAAIMAGVGAGIFPSSNAGIAAMVRLERHFEAGRAQHRLYEAWFALPAALAADARVSAGADPAGEVRTLRILRV